MLGAELWTQWKVNMTQQQFLSTPLTNIYSFASSAFVWRIYVNFSVSLSIYKSRKNKANSTAGQQLTNMFVFFKSKSECRF